MTDTADYIPAINAGTLRKIIKRLRTEAGRKRDGWVLMEVADAIEYVLNHESAPAGADVAKVVATTEEDRERYRP